MTERQEQSKQSASYLAKQDIHTEWQDDYLNPAIDRFYDLAFAKIIDALAAKPGDRILDAGCGYCYHAARLARAGLDVTGVDFSPAALSAAKANLAQQGLSIDLQQGDLRALPFADGAFPFASCWGVLMHIPELEKALAELARVLAPGGRLAIMENNSESWHVRRWEAAVFGAKRLLGRATPQRDITPRGVEEWREQGLMIRKLDIDWVTSFFAEHGLKQVNRFSGQFTELYTNVPGRFGKRLVYRWNERWFLRGGPPERALGNILIFEKQ